jgi:glutaredoxin
MSNKIILKKSYNSRKPSKKKSRSRKPSKKKSRSRKPSKKKSRSRKPSKKKSRSRKPSKKKSRSRKPSKKKSRSRKPKSHINKQIYLKNKYKTPLVIYTSDGCGACQKAKELLDKKNIKYKVYLRKDHEELVQKLTNNYQYVPVIIDKNKKFIGGYIELQKILD